MTSWGCYCFVRNVELLGGREVWKEVGVAGKKVVEGVLEEWHGGSCRVQTVATSPAQGNQASGTISA